MSRGGTRPAHYFKFPLTAGEDAGDVQGETRGAARQGGLKLGDQTWNGSEEPRRGLCASRGTPTPERTQRKETWKSSPDLQRPRRPQDSPVGPHYPHGPLVPRSLASLSCATQLPSPRLPFLSPRSLPGLCPPPRCPAPSSLSCLWLLGPRPPPGSLLTATSSQMHDEVLLALTAPREACTPQSLPSRHHLIVSSAASGQNTPSGGPHACLAARAIPPKGFRGWVRDARVPRTTGQLPDRQASTSVGPPSCRGT